MRLRHDIQGNILRGYVRHQHAAYLFARMGDHVQARELIAALVGEERIASDSDWGQPPPRTRLNVAFTHAGLAHLRVDLTSFARFPDFTDGMYERARTHLGDLGDNDPDHWDRRLSQDVHILLTIYGLGTDERDRALDELGQELRAADMTILHTQRADMLEDGREHFGFRDGFSQPALAGVAEDRRSRRGEGVQRPRLRLAAPEWRDVRLGEFVLGHRDEDGVVPGERDPLLVNGTFMVWRKLEQHVEAFNGWLQAAAGDDPDAARLINAQILGRWPDGVSLIRRPVSSRADPQGGPHEDTERPGHHPQINDFSYRHDPDGVRCPLGAHVRRANPRDALGFRTERTRRNRMIRRGMPYVDDDGSRGLVFVCFNASITRQFEQIQRHWLMGGDTFGLGADRDFLTAGLDSGQPTVRMTIQGDRTRPPAFITRDRQFVTVRGGYYLFVPGIGALRRMVAR